MKKRLSFILMSLAIILSSCIDDTGNYDYKSIPEFEITGIEEDYSVFILDNLKIEPQIASSSGTYSAVWFIEVEDSNAGLGNYDVTYADTLSHELVLDIPFKYKPGTYKLHLKVTNDETGVSQYANTSVEAVTKFSTGYYLLKETTDGNTEIDLHYPDGDITENIITMVTGAPLQGKPKTLSYLNNFSYLNEETGEKDINYLLIPLSENGMYTFSMTDMSIVRSYYQWFYSASEAYDVKKINHMNCFGYSFGLLTETGLFSNYQCADWGMLSVGKYSPYPDLMYNGISEYSTSFDMYYTGLEAFFYDATNKKLATIDYNGGADHVVFQYPALTANQSPVEEKFADNPIYLGGMASSMYNNLVIVCERDNGSRYWYYAYAEDLAYEVNIENKADFEASSAFANANIYATCRKDGNWLYAASGNDVYALNPADGTSKKLDIPYMPAGEITFMDTMWYQSYGNDSYNYFVVATYSNGNYTVALYEMVGGEPVKGKEPVKILQGKGKIKRIQHAYSGKTGNFGGLVSYSVHY